MSKNGLVIIDDIQSRIYTIRDVQVMLDRDLAIFYGVKPIRLREQVKRNIKRFPSDFMFQLTEEEVNFMVSQNAIHSKQHLGGSLPFVFIEQGVATISGVLTSERAIEVNIQIMRAFVAMRRFIASNAEVFQRLDAVEIRQIEHKAETDQKFEQIFNAIEKRSIKPKQGIFFDGQIFDAYQFVSYLIRKAHNTIFIISNYIDDTVLTHLTKRNKGVKVTSLTKTISKQLALDIKKFNEQYPSIEIKEFKDSHDRFIIIDNTTVYHFGASLKDIGKKWFAFSKMNIGAFEMITRLKGLGDE
ncbi:MAG: ORF6N domain protein [Candidatus Argoarchaeum ethanivorans]|uniref:ORF6N domain protein n=1 Tax=Candidatus Argoarchaeum ethanivorans TaxID=2608793 RepID=A0A811T902_9EURY|nr:MAG: ORF6N domain protein [Candidatus Argoarchaeum ethanivorans]